MFKNLDHIVSHALDMEWINEGDAPVLRRIISQRGWTRSLCDTGLNPKGEDLYAICADYL